MYREDPDLEFLKDCSNEDLDVLIKYLTKDKDGSSRITEELTSSDKYKLYKPNHKRYWDLIAAELQCFGADTFATLFRGGKGVLYREVLTDVCDKIKANYNKNSSIETIESNLIMKIFSEAVGNMSQEEINDIIKDLNLENMYSCSKEEFITNSINNQKIKDKIVVVVAKSIFIQFFKEEVMFSSDDVFTSTISILAKHINLELTDLWNIIDILGPAYRITIPSVIQVAYMRVIELMKLNNKIE